MSDLLLDSAFNDLPRCDRCGGLCGSDPSMWPAHLPPTVATYLIITMQACSTARLIAQWESIYQLPMPPELRQAWETATWPDWATFRQAMYTNSLRNRCPACGTMDAILRPCIEHAFSLATEERVALQSQITAFTGLEGAGLHAFLPYGCQICDQCLDEYRRPDGTPKRSAPARFCPLALTSGASSMTIGAARRKTLESQWHNVRGAEVATYRLRLLNQRRDRNLEADS